MKIKDFKKLVKEIVKQEMITQKEQILVEIKAELFDVMSAQKTSNVEKSSKINEEAEVSRASLRQMFEEKLGTNNDVFLNTSNVAVTPQGGLPKTFEGTRLTSDHEEVLDAINRDYSKLIKKMGV
jgi:ribosomal protein L29